MAHTTPDYSEIFKLLKADYVNKQVMNFLEVYLVLNNARPGALVHIEFENVLPLFKILVKHKVYLFRYKNNVFFAVKRQLLSGANKALFEEIKADPLADHPSIGKILGYMTPMNIFAVRGTGLSAYLIVEGETHDGIRFKSQIAPQVVMGKTEMEVRAYFAPIETTLNELKHQTAVVRIEEINTVVEPSKPVLKSLRKTRRKTRRLRKRKV
jgi:hypothetical protein